jgi:hypothetical protein
MLVPAFFGVAERVVDQVLDRLADRELLPPKAIVFGTNMPLLGALREQWNGKIEIVTILLPQASQSMLEAANVVLERERVDLSIWAGCETAIPGRPRWRALRYFFAAAAA